jgi:RES domain-containing protein
LTIPVRRFNGLVYRAHHPRWAFTPLSGKGAKKFGGRFNRPGTAALYTSLDLITAWMEAQQAFPFKPQPMTMAAYRVNCVDIVDLDTSEVQQCLGCSAADLGCAWENLAWQKREPPTWLLADRLQTQGIAGILVQSFAPGCTADNRNLVLWHWSHDAPHSIRVIDDLRRLPKSADSRG